MLTGLLAGIFWALETVVLGVALAMSPFISTAQAIMLAPFVSTFLHDTISSLLLSFYNLVRGKGRELLGVFKSDSLKWLLLASAVGGPVGMTGYVLAVNYMGASIGAVASAIYPAIGTLLAFIFLKEKVLWYQWVFLFFTLLGVFGLSYSPSVGAGSFWLGLLGAFMCAFGWGVEAVILARCLKDPSIKSEYALNIRQLTSAFIYGVIILPVLGGWEFTVGLFSGNIGAVLPTIAVAALSATVSYLLYYRTIGKIGASKAMALNITYTAWAIAFTVVIIGDVSVLNLFTLLCAAVVVVCGILAATDMKTLFARLKKQ